MGHPTTALELLTATREFFQTHAWGKGAAKNPDGSYCLFGGLASVAGYPDDSLIDAWDGVIQEAEALLSSAANPAYPKYASYVEYNDDPQTTFEDVDRLLARAIDAAARG